jgi:hypothetical protein
VREGGFGRQEAGSVEAGWGGAASEQRGRAAVPDRWGERRRLEALEKDGVV